MFTVQGACKCTLTKKSYIIINKDNNFLTLFLTLGCGNHQEKRKDSKIG